MVCSLRGPSPASRRRSGWRRCRWRAGESRVPSVTAWRGAAAGDAAVVEVGRRVPGYSAVSLTGGPASLAELRGRVVLLNVWATWCVPCRTEMPDLEALHQLYASRGLSLVGVSIDASSDAERVKEFAAERRVSYALWHDGDDRVSGLFYAVGVPATYLIGRDGVLRWKRLGPLGKDEPELDAVLTKALEEAGPIARD